MCHRAIAKTIVYAAFRKAFRLIVSHAPYDMFPLRPIHLDTYV
jgi:hypothetical protein